MELASKYNPLTWKENGISIGWTTNSLVQKPDGREPYTVVIPPPNVTGVLHMGHMLNNTIQDILVRRAAWKARMPAGCRERPCFHCHRSQSGEQTGWTRYKEN